MAQVKLKEILRLAFSKHEMESIASDLLLDCEVEKVLNIEDFVSEVSAHEVRTRSGPHRKKEWEEGWAGTGTIFDDTLSEEVPYYFSTSRYLRVKSEVYLDRAGFLELHALRCLQKISFLFLAKHEKDLSAEAVCEYGAGIGSNIKFLQNQFPGFRFYGADWVESARRRININCGIPMDRIYKVNFFDSYTFQSPGENFIAFTNAALEQCGNQAKSFLHYLVSNKRCLYGIHIEPVIELMDTSEPLDRQSASYIENRGYLKGLLPTLAALPEIEIIKVRNYGIGSKYLSGYQVIIWQKIK